MELDQTYVSTQGVVRYSIAGSGPDVVLVHGTPWSAVSWQRVWPELTKHYRVHVYDLIGYGQSEKRAGQRVSLDVQGELLAALLTHWRLRKPVVVAHDFGGATALRAHLLHGCDYARLALINVVALSPWGSPFFAHVQKHEAAFAGVPAYIHEAIVERYIQGALHQPLEATLLRQLVVPWLDADGQSGFYRQIAQASERYTREIEPHYDNIRCPVAILWGEEDAWIPIDIGRRLHQSIPNSTFTPLPQAGHLAPLEAAKAIVEELFEFLSESESAS